MITWGGLAGFAFLALLVLKRAMPKSFQWLNASFDKRNVPSEKLSERSRDEGLEPRVPVMQNKTPNKFSEIGQAEAKFYFAYHAIQAKPIDVEISDMLRPEIAQIKNESADIVSIDAYRKKSNG